MQLNFGITNFDNLGTSFLTVFQMITSETWYVTMMNLMDVDFPIIGALYSFGIIIVGQFFLLNLILAVIIQAFMKTHEKKLEEEIQKLEEDYGDDDEYGEEEHEEYDDQEEEPIEEEDEQDEESDAFSEEEDSL